MWVAFQEMTRLRDPPDLCWDADAGEVKGDAGIMCETGHRWGPGPSEDHSAPTEPVTSPPLLKRTGSLGSSISSQ